MSQVFGSRVLPPPSVLPGKVSDAVEAWRSAQERSTQAQAVLAKHKRDALPAARRKDVEAHADSIEQGSTPPKRGAHEERALSKLVELERAVEASQLVQQRAYARMNAAIEERGGDISHLAEKRASEAKERYLAAIDQLAEAVEELRQAFAFKTWASDTSASYKARGLRAVPVPQHGNEPDIGSVLGALRDVIEAPRKPGIPSPFTAPAPEPAPAREDESAPVTAA